MAKVMDKQGKTEKLSQTRRDWGGMTTGILGQKERGK